MYNLSYEQLRRRTIISFAISAILLITMIILAAINDGVETAILIFFPIIAIIWALEVLGILVCWRDLWKPFLRCFADAFKSLVGAGATGSTVIGFFINFAKSFGLLSISFFKALIIAINVTIFVLKGKNNAN